MGAVLASAAAFVSILFVSWQLTLQIQKAQLDRDAMTALARVESIYADAVTTLREIASNTTRPCSPANIRQMVKLTESSRSVINIAYGANNVVECNTWGLLNYVISKNSSQVRQSDGIDAVFNWKPQTFGTYRSLLILRLNNYSVLVDQQDLFSDWVGSMASNISSIHANDGTPLRANYNDVPRTSETGFSEASSRNGPNGWSVTVRQPRITFPSYLRSEPVVFLPLLIAIALLSGSMAWFWLRWRLSLRYELAAAVRKGAFIAHYQPIIDLTTWRCDAAEALARWQRSDGSHVPPDVFVPLAESFGLMERITDQIVAAVMRDLGDWLRQDPNALIGINLSAADLSTGRILPVLDRALSRSGVNPRQIWLEVTEHGMIDITGAQITLAELHRRGHLIAIDDFGTGYSGLSYLQQLQIDALKIDRSFVKVIGTEAPTRNVTQQIIAMARELNLKIVAEGVETEEQAAYLRSNGVEFAQGWLFSAALPASDFLAFRSSWPGPQSAS
ncbi:EAL domain-containing protein [Flavimaribacter sediminis]|nr:EAL domain-containing protein [Flavimaribacter sediminis]